MKFGLTTCVLLIASLLTGCRYTKDLEILTPQQALQDLHVVSNSLREMHVDPWHTISEAAFNASEEKIRQDIQKKARVSRHKFALQLAKLLTSVGDDHTRLELYPPYSKHLKSGGSVFPLKLEPQDEGAFISRISPTIKKEYPQLAEGHQLLAINGQPLSSFLDEVSIYVSKPTEALKHRRIIDEFRTMAWYYWGTPDKFNITLKKTDGETYHTIIRAGHYTTVPATQPKSIPKQEPFEHVFYDDGNICVLRANSFAATPGTDRRKFSQRWQMKLDAVFKQLRQRDTDILIVDVRQNGGGDPSLGFDLLKRISTKRTISGTKHWRNSIAWQKNLLRYELHLRGIPAWLMLDHLLNLQQFSDLPNPHKQQSEYIHITERRNPVADPWTRQFVLLTGPDTFSAATDMASVVKDNQLGLILGEETGGRASYYTALGTVLLPNSGLVANFATLRWTRPAGFDDGRGVLPDHPLDPSLSDEQMAQHVKQILATNVQAGR